MKICFVSDLHCDVGSQPSIRWPEADVLVVAGDVANSIGEVEKFFRKLSRAQSYEHIVYVDGNHEHYSNAPQDRTIMQTLARLAELVPDVVMLPLIPHIKIGSHYFIGRNGWYSMDAAGDPVANQQRWRERMNDNKWIGFDKLGIAMPWDRAKEDAEIVSERIRQVREADPEARFIIVTHTAPTRETLSQRPEHLLDNAFYANLHMEKVLEDHGSRIDYWVHGHTHYRQMKQFGSTTMIVNPRGYPSENPSWEPIVIEV